jgi:hypothetical protein
VLTDPKCLYEPGGRTRKRSPERDAIERIFREATLERPMSNETIADLSGVSLSVTRSTVRNIVRRGHAHNVDPSLWPSQYAWGKEPTPAPVARERHTTPPGSYSGADLRPFTARTTSSPPSLQHGRRVEHRPPVSLATPAAKEWGL